MKLIGVFVCLVGFFVSANAVTKSLDSYYPIHDKKPVVAHYMTCNLPGWRGTFYPEMFRPDGEYAAIGGWNLAQPMITALERIPLKDKYEQLDAGVFDEMILFEMKSAKKLGVDGFQFFLPFRNDAQGLENAHEYFSLIRRFFVVADQHQVDFYLTVDISHPKCGNDTGRAVSFSTPYTTFWPGRRFRMLSP